MTWTETSVAALKFLNNFPLLKDRTLPGEAIALDEKVLLKTGTNWARLHNITARRETGG